MCLRRIINLVNGQGYIENLSTIEQVFSSPEDAVSMKGAKVKYDHPDIERVRRGHLNDLENITVFFIVALAFLLTNPSPGLAINLFRAFTIARIGHTIVYCVIPIPQPARFLFCFVGWAITVFMAGSVILELM